MRHVSITCKNHPDLRWSCKDIAWNVYGRPDKDGRLGGYNGCRNIFFGGQIDNPPQFHDDMSGTKDNMVDKDGKIVKECSCPARDLILAPEDAQLKAAHEAMLANDDVPECPQSST